MRIWITAQACITSILFSFIAGKFNDSSSISAPQYCLSTCVSSYQHKVKVKLIAYGRQEGQPSRNTEKNTKHKRRNAQQLSKTAKQKSNIQSKKRLHTCSRGEHLQWDSSSHGHLQYAHYAIRKLPVIQLPYLQSCYWINDLFLFSCIIKPAAMQTQ